MSFASLGNGLLGTAQDTPHKTPRLAGHFDGNHALVPLLTPAVPAVTDQIKVATTLARAANTALSVITPISVPEQTPKTVGHNVIDDDDSALLDWALEQTADATAHLDGGFLYTRDIVTGVLRTVKTREIDTLVLPSEPGGRLRKSITERIAAQADCDVVVVNGQAGYEQVASMLLPIAGGPHSGLAADLAQSIAADCDAWIDILHIIEEDASEQRRTQAATLVEEAAHRIACPETTSTWVLEAEDVAEAIIDQSQYYGLTIMGAPTTGRLRRFIHGSTNHSVRASARSVVLSARNNSSRSSDAE
ncbi:universal stress protein [Halosimplex pelagicum]|uniref:Universal stress protein n=1 Tax=Halosimplex pelagicum TaxID=869886 RepID=A0A7D5PET9_9EURY|nr:universal stress protein [Halosimplex pelagicum]QLH82420.1 universal stress protein [Halosimplex pelagicum]